jgi:glycosyltransferase involved in cell wall biosynthesis
MDSFVQVMREWPPGYGGVERVAHELASEWGTTVFSFDAQSRSADEIDPLPVSYPRVVLPTSPPLGRLLLPLPSRALWCLLRSHLPLYGHLPSPGVLLVLLLARLLQPRRPVVAHWHCFVAPEPGSKNRLFALYQWLALRVVPLLTKVVTTSPVLAKELIRCGCQPRRVAVLPCCLNAEQEKVLLTLPSCSATAKQLRVLFIGRLDSYKRLDWLLEALALLKDPWSLSVVGDGPRRPFFEALSEELFGASSAVTFFGRLDESAKLAKLASADVLVLPSDRSTEAFGIVQLEAMAAGIPSLAFKNKRSGMGWVGQLSGLPWSQQPDELSLVLHQLAISPTLRMTLSLEARDRYLNLFARKVWLQALDAVFSP